MEIITYLCIFLIILNPLLFLIISLVEKNLDEKSRFGKWWRNNVVGVETKDDITK